ncbi:MAG TPA: AI-2E family transporter [Methanoculleus sp.]|nr:AI-2E family transporter [Methanoculleus sp.]
MTADVTLAAPLRALVASACTVVLLAGMHLGASIINVVLFSFFLSVLALPALRYLEGRGIPTIGAVLILIAGLALIAVLFIATLNLSVPELEEAISAYRNLLAEQITRIGALIEPLGLVVPDMEEFDIISATTSLIPTIASIVSGLIQFLLDVLLVMILAVFMLLEVSKWGDILEKTPKTAHDVISQFVSFSATLIEYVAIRIKVNFIVGVATALLLWAMGIQSALLWGVVVFVMSFIPYFGLPLASIPPAGIAWLQIGLPGALIVLAGIAAVNFVADTIIFPQMASTRLDLSPPTVIVSILLWTWVLGVPGLFLGVPLTLMVKYLLAGFEETRWIAALMGPAPPPAE